MPIVFRISSGQSTTFSTNLAVRYPFTSDLQDSVTGDSGASNGASAQFDGGGYISADGRFIAMPTSFTSAMHWGTGDGTLSWWQTVTGNNTGNNYFLNDREGQNGRTAGEIGMGFFGNSVWNLHRGGTSSWEYYIDEPRSSFSIGPGATQQHIVLVRDTSDQTFKLYIDGTLETTDGFGAAESFGSSSNTWRLGNFNAGSSYTYGARIADLTVWKGRALSDEEVSDLYTLGRDGTF